MILTKKCYSDHFSSAEISYKGDGVNSNALHCTSTIIHSRINLQGLFSIHTVGNHGHNAKT